MHTQTPLIYEQDVDMPGIPAETTMALAQNAAISLGWMPVFANEHTLLVHTPYRDGVYEEVLCELLYDTLRISSRSGGEEREGVPINQANVIALAGQIETYKKAYGFVPAVAPVPLPEEPDVFATEVSPLKDKGVVGLFVPRRGYAATPIIVLLNILVYLLMVASGADFLDPDAKTLFSWGGNLGYRTANGEWWRLLTAVFLHGGLMHMLMNMYALVFVGVILEPALGTLRFATTYLVTGVVASLVSILAHAGTVSIGASGAIFGMYGVYIALLTTSMVARKQHWAALLSAALYVIYSLANGVKEQGVDNAAHIGGLLGGLAAGYALYYTLKHNHSKTTTYIVLKLMVLVVFLLSVAVFSRVG
jgi:rhomboid protease GluP